jgi:hypothetical protein
VKREISSAAQTAGRMGEKKDADWGGTSAAQKVVR